MINEFLLDISKIRIQIPYLITKDYINILQQTLVISTLFY